MPPLPYPHRVSFLAAALALPTPLEHLALLSAKLLGALVFDHLVRHPMVSVGDFDDERLTDDQDRLVDARHAGAEEAIDWFLRVGRRQEVLWLDVSLDPQRAAPVRLRSRRAAGPIDEWVAPGGALTDQVGAVIDQWLDARRLPRAGMLPAFTRDDLVNTAQQLHRALDAARDTKAIPPELATAPARLGVAFYRVLADMTEVDGDWDRKILALDPTHVVARRNLYLASIADKGDRRAILPLIAEARMYAKPHLSVFGDAFAADRPIEGMGLHHQGVAAMLAPANAWACHNYSIQLDAAYRREESYRWCDRATIAAPELDTAHLDCVRRLRVVQRPGQAFAEATFRCNDVLERWRAGARHDWAIKHQAAMLLAQAHVDIGRLDEGVRIGRDALAELPPEHRDKLGWAIDKVHAWATSPRELAHAYAVEGYHRGDPGRVVEGLVLAGMQDHDDVYRVIDALIAIGRDDLALCAFHHFQGMAATGIVGDGKGRLAGARAHLLAGELAHALEQWQIVQLRRPQSRFEAEINRVLRLAACARAEDWDAVIARRLEQGATTLAKRAARDLADFVPGANRPAILHALGERTRWTVDPRWVIALSQALPRLGAAAAAIDERLAPPAEHTLAAADVLAQEWWTVLPPPNRDKDVHAAAAVYALGVALSRYLSLCSGEPTPLGGAYRHIATEALHLVRRARYHIEDTGVRGLLALLEACAPDVEEWLLDTWLLRIEHAFDLDNENGSYLPALLDGLPKISALIRGDERIGWELRLAWDLRTELGELEAAGVLYERCSRAVEAGAVYAAWSDVADATQTTARAIDIHWLAAIANPTHRAGPWVNLARAQFEAGRGEEARESLCRAFTSTPDDQRRTIIGSFAAAWSRAKLDVPFPFDAAQATGLAALAANDLALAERCLKWCQAQDPKNGVIGKNLGIVHGALGRLHDAIRAFAVFDRTDPGRHAGTALLQAQQHAPAVTAYRYAAAMSGKFKTADDWRLLAVAAWYAEDDAHTAIGYERYLAAGGVADAQTLHGLAGALYRTGQWSRCEEIARQLIQLAGNDPTYRSCGLHAMARALAGQGKHGDATRCAMEAQQLNPLADNTAEFAETVALCQAGKTPPSIKSAETSVERRAWDALAAGDMVTPEQLAASGNSWGLFRAALQASELRADGDTVPAKALEAALMVLDRTIGNPIPDAALCRTRALRLREAAFIQIDAPTPLGPRRSRAEFAAEYARRSQTR